MSSTGDVLREFKEVAERVYSDRLERIVLFGSHARGDATPDSDVDVLLVLRGEVAPGREIDRLIDAIVDLNLKHGTLLSLVPVSSEAYAHGGSPLLLNARREGVPV